ncbi:MAG TPA: hypothetical protein VE843_14195, partial [Ktedonobacteraceae bacterium]|nr:hypothetical protein [Ktedonobacteraceae bacterium]
ARSSRVLWRIPEFYGETRVKVHLFNQIRKQKQKKVMIASFVIRHHLSFSQFAIRLICHPERSEGSNASWILKSSVDY